GLLAALTHLTAPNRPESLAQRIPTGWNDRHSGALLSVECRDRVRDGGRPGSCAAGVTVHTGHTRADRVALGCASRDRLRLHLYRVVVRSGSAARRATRRGTPGCCVGRPRWSAVLAVRAPGRWRGPVRGTVQRTGYRRELWVRL